MITLYSVVVTVLSHFAQSHLLTLTPNPNP